jgi:hypothetical protein
VPALIFSESTNFALADCLASRSFGNVSVALALFRFPRGRSNETYHVPWDLLVMRPLRGLGRRLTAVGGTSIEGERNRSACCLAALGIRFQQRPGRTAFRAKMHQRASLSHGRGIGRLFGNGICPVIGGSSVPADACAYCARLRIAAAARWKAAAACCSALGR